MSIVVIGGHSRSVGKTSVAAGLIARLVERNWTACKVTQFGHGFCSADGGPCDCQTDDHTVGVSIERAPDRDAIIDAAHLSDSARFLAAGAKRSLWIRTRIGHLAEAMPRIRKEIAQAENILFESNTLVQFLRPDLYLVVLDHAVADFKDSALRMLDRADALLIRTSSLELEPRWKGVSRSLIEGKPRFLIRPPDFLAEDLVAFVEERMGSGRPDA